MEFNKVKTCACPVPTHTEQIERIKGKIVAADGVLVCDEKTALPDLQVCVDECAVVVILLCPETEADAYVQNIIYATQTGKRLIGVWPEAQASGGDFRIGRCVEPSQVMR